MNYLSVCSGIEAASVAWKTLGWSAVGFSEIEKFPCSVLKYRYPETENFGDMTKFKEWPDANIDVLVGGTPCQSFSVAGLRKGLDDPRGNLMLTYLAIADRYKPKYIVWENVAGILSSNGGRDFGTFLGGLGKLGYGFAYRVLDAQFCRTHEHPRAVPQRRRRVFVVGCLGDWRSAAGILFDSESLRGNPPPSRNKGEEIAPTIRAGAANGGNHTRYDDTGSSYTLTKTDVHAVAYNLYGGNKRSDRPNGGFYANVEPTSKTLDASHGLNPNCSQGGTAIQQQMRVRRLTPLECERLQGFPDFWTDIPGASNTARYKALGNSMAVNSMRILGERIAMAESIL